MEQEKELGCGIRVNFVLAKSFIRSPASIPTPDSRCTSSERNEKILGNRPDGCFLPSAGAYAIVSKEKTLLAEGPIPERRQALGQVGTSRKGLRPGAALASPLASRKR